jgi:high-affinity iron transporter
MVMLVGLIMYQNLQYRVFLQRNILQGDRLQADRLQGIQHIARVNNALHPRLDQFLILVFTLFVMSLFGIPAWATPQNASHDAAVQPLLHILDYVAVDYPGVFQNGKIKNKQEYAEQKEFAARLVTLSEKLPESGNGGSDDSTTAFPSPKIANMNKVVSKATLVGQAKRIYREIQQRSAPAQVAKLCAEMNAQLIASYNVAVAPRSAPAPQGVSSLFQQNCAACHGAEGYGNGPNAQSLQPRPANFHDGDRQQYRSIYSLYNTISLGVDGTAMPSFSQMTSEQRWQLAFYVSNFYANDAVRQTGAKLWSETPSLPAIQNLQQLTQATPAQLRKINGDDGVAVLAYLRANPSQLTGKTITRSPWTFASESLTDSVDAYIAGNKESAYELSVAAYLEGFELVETQLNTVAPELRKQIEKDMMTFRDMIKSDANATDLRTTQQNIVNMLDEAQSQLSTNKASSVVNFFSALLILLREGIEAILILAAIAAVLNKTGRSEGMRYIHYGWVSALGLGFVTWLIAVNTITISGANREFTEGVTALVAAAMLIYVGFWLHKQTYALQWQHFIKAKISNSLSNGALTGLAVVAFLAVYREVFESILFFQTLSLQSGPAGNAYIVGGALTAAALLALVAWLIFKFSVRLPMKLFFRINAVFLYALAIVFTGKGIAALQKAGLVPVNPINIFEIEALGVYPNLQSIGMQLLMVVIAVALIWYSRKKLSRDY